MALDCAHTPGLLRVHASPVLIAELDAPICTQTNCQEEETRPDTSNDQSNGKEGECGTRHDEWSGQKYS